MEGTANTEAQRWALWACGEQGAGSREREAVRVVVVASGAKGWRWEETGPSVPVWVALGRQTGREVDKGARTGLQEGSGLQDVGGLWVLP